MSIISYLLQNVTKEAMLRPEIVAKMKSSSANRWANVSERQK
jgi:hypothetical protein